MINSKKQSKQLRGQRKKMAEKINLTEMIRGTMLKRYLECARPNCRCHKATEHRHGPYYFLAIRRKNKTMHVYVPQNMVKAVKKWAANYDKAWQGIEKITDINVKLIRLSGK